MPYCQRCGAPLDPGSQYCQGCGDRVDNASEGAAATSPPYVVPTAGRSRTPQVIALVAVLLVVAITLGALALWNGQDRTASGGVTLSMVDLVDPAEGTLPADPGNRYVQVILTLANRAGGAVALGPSDFQLLGDDGSYYEHSPYATADMPEVVTDGGSATLTVGFEVPEGVRPVKIVYNGQYA
jgi:hypothetical protein